MGVASALLAVLVMVVVPTAGAVLLMKGLGFAGDGWAVVFRNEIDGTFSVNCLVKRPGGQPGTSVSSPTLVKSRSWKGKNAEFSVTSLAQPRVWYAMLVA